MRRETMARAKKGDFGRVIPPFHEHTTDPDHGGMFATRESGELCPLASCTHWSLAGTGRPDDALNPTHSLPIEISQLSRQAGISWVPD